MEYAIVVRVKGAETRNCFIATPYDAPKLEEILHVVIDAARRAKLLPLLAKEIGEETTFVQEVSEGIRSAQVVVAVCSSQDREGSSINRNVFYELGLAHAIGKPTIILTTKTKSLDDLKKAVPSDLLTRDLLTYGENEIRSGALVANLLARIQGILLRMQKAGRSLTDPAETAVSEASHWSIVHPESWELFLGVIQFAKRVHNVFQDFEVYLAEVRREVEETIRRPEIGLAGGITIGNKWRALLKHYRSLPKKSLIAGLDKDLQDVDRFMGTLMAGEAGTGGRLMACKEQYEIVKKKLLDYRPLAQRLETEASNPEVFTEQSEKSTTSLLLLVVELADQTTSLEIEADTLLLTLTNVLSAGD